MSTLMNLANTAVGYSNVMASISQRMNDPETFQNPGKLAMFNIEFSQAVTAYEVTAQTVKKIHQQDQTLIELLRDA